MHDNKVSEKVVWENYNPEDDVISPTASTMSYQPHMPQMMICYKCNREIPDKSKFCPWCQAELYTICPKCGEQYSSEYPSCYHCGTNRGEYLKAQVIIALLKQKEQAEALEREERRQKAISEQKRYEERLQTHNGRTAYSSKVLYENGDLQSRATALKQNYINDENRNKLEEDAKRRVKEAYLAKKNDEKENIIIQPEKSKSSWSSGDYLVVIIVLLAILSIVPFMLDALL